MLLRSWRTGALALIICCAFAPRTPAQNTLLDVVQTVALPGVAAPVEHSFSVSIAGTYHITLTDLGAQLPAPAPLASVQMAITSGAAIVGTPLTAPGTATISAQPGTYVIHVVGTPGAVPGSGPIGIAVTNASNTLIDSFSDTLATPPASIPDNTGVLSGTFTVPTSGSYQVTLSDLQFPQSLRTLLLAITQQGGEIVTTLAAAGTTVLPAGTLQPNTTYDVFAIGQAGGALNAGLFGVTIAPAGGGALTFAHTTPVGAVALLGSPALAAQNYTLKLSDLANPGPLAQLGAVVALNGQAVAQLAAAGMQAFVGSAGTYQVFALAEPGASGQGSYAVALEPASGITPFSVARAVVAAGGALAANS